MLPVPNLDDEMYEDIFIAARNMIPKFYPQWTDYNKHDPGITFLELFSWLKEMQQFHLNQTSPSVKMKYLKLTGVSLKYKNPAQVRLFTSALNKNLMLPAYSKFYKDNICFENTEKSYLTVSKPVKLFSSDGTEIVFAENTGVNMRFVPFGESHAENSCFIMVFSEKFPAAHKINIYFEVYDGYSVKRNPISDYSKFYPLADIEAECYTACGWKKALIVSDETCGFIRSGCISIMLKSEFSDMSEYDGGYALRFILRKNNYDVPPVFTDIKMNVISAVQKETSAFFSDFAYKAGYPLEIPFSGFSEDGTIEVYTAKNNVFVKNTHFSLDYDKTAGRAYINFDYDIKDDFDTVRAVSYDSAFFAKRIIGCGTGFPYQKIELENQNIMHESFEIMIYDDYEKGYIPWEKVDDFDNSDKCSRHYVFDENTGTLYFGDSENGLSPEGEIMVISFSETLGKRGNIKEYQLKNSVFADIAEITNFSAGKGGSETQTSEECFDEFNRSLKKQIRAVTFEDYEQAAAETDGLMIKKCKAVSTMALSGNQQDSNSVTLIVQPFSLSEKPVLNKSYIENIARNISDKRLIGTKINIISPEYININIYADVVVKSHYHDAEGIIKQTVRNMFENEFGDFGSTVSYTSVYYKIDTLSCVSYIRSLTITRRGRGSVVHNNDIILPDSGLAYLKDISCSISYND